MSEWSIDRKNQKTPTTTRTKQDVRAFIETHRKKIRQGANPASLRAGLRAAQAHLTTLTAHYHIRDRRRVETYIRETEQRLDDIASGVMHTRFDDAVAPYLELVQQMETDHADTGTNARPRGTKRNVAQIVEKTGECRLLKKPKSQAVLDVTTYDEHSLRDELGAVFDNETPPVFMGQIDTCETCNIPLVIMATEALLGCTQCSRVRPYLQVTSSRIPFGEEVEFSGFSYKRQNHFQEWLNAIQAKENTEVPNSVIEDIMAYMYRNGVRNESQITQPYLRQVLKEMGLKKQYDHTMQIYVSITGKLPPRFSTFQEEQLRLMFEAIQGPFQKHCPPDRKNFLSYAYCLYKFCELLGYDHFLKYFTLLKGVDKLYKQDIIFKKICEELDWQFIPSSKCGRQSAEDGAL